VAAVTQPASASVLVTPTWAIGSGIAIDTMYVDRSTDDVNFTPVYEGAFGPFTDHAAPFNVPVRYRVAVSGLYGTERHYSNWVWASPVTLEMQTVWIKSTEDPSLNARFPVADSWLETSVTKRRSPHHPLGSRLPVVSKDEGTGEMGAITFTVQDEQVDAILALLESNHKLVLQMPKRQLFVEVAEAYEVRDHIFDIKTGDTDLRQVTMPFIEVAE
jgi:hypothetical protein